MFNLIVKDIKNIIYDFKSLMFIAVMPIALMSILGMSLQGVFSDTMSSDIFDMEIGIVKAYDYESDIAKVDDMLTSDMFSGSGLSTDSFGDYNPETTFFEDFMDSEMLSNMITYEVYSIEDAKIKLEAEEIQAYVVLPKNFVYNSYMNFMSVNDLRYLTEVEIIKSKDTRFDFQNMILTQIIETYFTGMNSFVSQNKIANQVMIDYPFIPEGAMDAMRDEMMEDARVQIEIATESIPGSKSVDSFQYYAAAIMAMFLMYSASVGARALYDETKVRTFQRLEVAGKTYPIMSVSNFIRIMMVVIFQSVIMIGYSSMVLDVHWGSFANTAVVLLLSSFAVAGIGTFIATLTINFNNPKIANVFEFAVVQLMALLGGSFLPVEVLPKGFQKLQFLSLNAYVLGGYLNGMYERAISEMGIYMIGMFGFGIAFIALSALAMKFRNREAIA